MVESFKYVVLQTLANSLLLLIYCLHIYRETFTFCCIYWVTKQQWWHVMLTNRAMDRSDIDR